MSTISVAAVLRLAAIAAVLQVAQCVQPGLSPHFRRWLSDNGYRAADFARDDLQGGSFGGRETATDTVRRQPVVFVHGNSDRALGGSMGGWAEVASFFESRGYKRSELYATTWGPANVAMATLQRHTLAYVRQLRAFISAVLRYTGADKVDVISHSMGVTLARKAIKGGRLEGAELGRPLTGSVDTFVGIAGGNYGLTGCFAAPTLPACSRTNGFYPGVFNPLLQRVTQRSAYLQDLLSVSGYEGAHRYAIWSPSDEVIALGCVVYGRITCHFPGMTADKRADGLTHLETKSRTAGVQLAMITDHVVP